MTQPYVPDANYGGEGGPGFDYAKWQQPAQQPLSAQGVQQHAYDPNQTNGIGYQLANSGRDDYKSQTAYSNAIGQGMDEESAKRYSYDANGYANYNYDGTQRSSYSQNQMAPTAERAEAANQADFASRQAQNAQPQQPQSGGAGASQAPLNQPQYGQQSVQRMRPAAGPRPGIGGTNPGLGPSGFGTQPQMGINRTYNRPMNRGF